MRILALEAYYGGSHRAFVDGWRVRSRYEWTALTLPAHKWKWRMRHAAVTFAEQLAERVAAGEAWDMLVCSDMLNLAELVGLAPEPVQRLPRMAYFHENQLTYPVRRPDERDLHFAFTNLTTALAASEVWFNSGFHRDSFLDALGALLPRMPDYAPAWAVEAIRVKSVIHPPGIDLPGLRRDRPSGPMRILWAARWEHDKNPETFFQALLLLADRGVKFRLSVVGEQFKQSPAVFGEAWQRFASRIDRWGYQDSRAEYEAALAEADVIVSTADHEFFGLSVVEAVAAGAYPLLPRRLAYPEVLGGADTDEFFYSGEAAELADRLARLADAVADGTLWAGDSDRARRIISRFSWETLVPGMDDAVERLCSDRRGA